MLRINVSDNSNKNNSSDGGLRIKGLEKHNNLNDHSDAMEEDSSPTLGRGGDGAKRRKISGDTLVPGCDARPSMVQCLVGTHARN